LLAGSALYVRATEPGKHLFILSGQSNMELLDPNLTFIPAVAAEFGTNSILVVKDAKSGQPIRRWYKKWKPAADGVQIAAPGDLYDRLMKKVQAAIQGEKIKTVTLVWMQGERDAGEGHGSVYAASLKGLLEQFKADLGRDDINFIIGRISDFDLADAKYHHWTMVRKAQVEVAEALPYSVWVDTDDLNDGLNRLGKTVQNDLHCSVAGYEILGKRFADKAIELVRKRGQ
jgi:hypothetical protein